MKKNNHIPLFYKIIKRYTILRKRKTYSFNLPFQFNSTYIFGIIVGLGRAIVSIVTDENEKGSSPFHATLGYNFRGAIGCFDQLHCFRANRQLPATLLLIDRFSTSMRVTTVSLR